MRATGRARELGAAIELRRDRENLKFKFARQLRRELRQLLQEDTGQIMEKRGDDLGREGTREGSQEQWGTLLLAAYPLASL
jgi:hypothetical protein